MKSRTTAWILGAISFVPRDASLSGHGNPEDELTLVGAPKHLLAKKREVDVANLEKKTSSRTGRIALRPAAH